MKNVFKLMGIIALFAVIGFSIASCGDGGGGGCGRGDSAGRTATLVVNNEYSYPIIEIYGIDLSIQSTMEDLNITQGSSKTFYLDMGEFSSGYSCTVLIYTSNPDFYSVHFGRKPADQTYVRFERNKTTAITLTNEGKITYTAPR